MSFLFINTDWRTYTKWKSKAPGFVANTVIARDTDFHSMIKMFL